MNQDQESKLTEAIPLPPPPPPPPPPASNNIPVKKLQRTIDPNSKPNHGPYLIFGDWLFQGSQFSVWSNKFTGIREKGITHIVNITEKMAYKIPDDLQTVIFTPI